MLPATLLREFRARWEAGKDTWNTFAGIPWQVDDRKCYLTRFCGDSVPGGRQRKTPGTLLRGFRARWKANLSDTGRDDAMKMKIMENFLLFVVNSYFRRAKKWKHANHG